jgi:hypothetical protein
VEVFEFADALHASAKPAKPEKAKAPKPPKSKPAGKAAGKKKSAAHAVEDTWSSPQRPAKDGKVARDARDALKQSLKAKKVDTRLHAAVALRDLGDMPNFEEFVAEQLSFVESFNGLAYALGIIEKGSPMIRDALLRGARDRAEVAPHFAAKLCQLAGKAKTEFDWEMRPFFLRFGEQSPPEERAKAYKELLKMISAKDPP